MFLPVLVYRNKRIFQKEHKTISFPPNSYIMLCNEKITSWVQWTSCFVGDAQGSSKVAFDKSTLSNQTQFVVHKRR